MSRRGPIWAVVPVKDLRDAKQRLSPALTPAERRALYRAMLEDVLAALAAAPGLAGILVVSRDAAAGALAGRYGARVLHEVENKGQSAAVSAAAALLAREGAAGLFALPGDAPLVTAAEIEAALATHGPAPAMTIVPAWDGRGSNGIISSPPDLIRFAFGNDSFGPHLAAARAAGVEPRVVPLPGLGLDIDTPGDLRRLMARPQMSRAQEHLRRSGIAARLARDEEGSP